MEWDEKLQRIINCIESSLDYGEGAIDAKEIEEIAGCSYAFFQKVFSYMNGISRSDSRRYEFDKSEEKFMYICNM